MSLTTSQSSSFHSLSPSLSLTLNASSSSADHSLPWDSRLSLCTVASTLAACSPPITAVRELGQVNMKLGEYARPHMPLDDDDDDHEDEDDDDESTLQYSIAVTCVQ